MIWFDMIYQLICLSRVRRRIINILLTVLGTILSKLQRLLALSTPHNSTYNSSLRILTTCKPLSAQCLLKSSLKTRVNYLCSPLDPKLLEALYAQAPPGPQSFLSGLSLEGMKGLYAERRQKKP